jgi:hypothetical protein
MKVLEQCRCSFDVGPPPPRHAHSHPICSKFSPVSVFFPFFSSGSLLFFFPSQALEILPLLSAIDSSEGQKLLRKNSKEQKTETSFTYSSVTFYEKKISVSDR